MSITFTSGKELLSLCARNHLSVGEVMLLRETEQFDVTREEALQRMAHSWEIMKTSVREGQENETPSMGGLIGGEAKKLSQHRQAKGSLLGETAGKAMSYAMGVLEVNASMGLIVAAPTAGSAGVIPGVFLALQETYGFSDDQMVMALFHAGAIGYLATLNATVAGAEGGCQAEIGTAAAMAASAAAELLGASPSVCLDAASITMASMLGLVCDPIGGLVEAPCQKRNGVAAVNALTACEMALSGVRSIVPYDEMLEVMLRVGKSLPYELRETALGGVAAAPSALEACRNCSFR